MEAPLAGLELRTNRAYWGDGLLDVLCGVALLSIGVSWVTHQAVFGAVVPALLIPLWKPLRARFTEPRLGVVELGEGRQQRNRDFMLLMLVAGVASFVLGVGAFLLVTHVPDFSVYVVKAMPGLLVGLAALATARALQLRRFTVYGAITIAGAGVVAAVSILNPGWAFVAGGAACLVVGIVLVRRFAHAHPVAEAGA